MGNESDQLGFMNNLIDFTKVSCVAMVCFFAKKKKSDNKDGRILFVQPQLNQTRISPYETQSSTSRSSTKSSKQALANIHSIQNLIL